MLPINVGCLVGGAEGGAPVSAGIQPAGAAGGGAAGGHLQEHPGKVEVGGATSVSLFMWLLNMSVCVCVLTQEDCKTQRQNVCDDLQRVWSLLEERQKVSVFVCVCDALLWKCKVKATHKIMLQFGSVHPRCWLVMLIVLLLFLCVCRWYCCRCRHRGGKNKR